MKDRSESRVQGPESGQHDGAVTPTVRRHGKPLFVRPLIVVVWLCFVGWLIRYEAYPEYFTRSLDGYESLLSRDLLVMDSWMRILFNGTPIGYSHTSMSSDESDPSNQYTVENDVQLAFTVMGEQTPVRVSSSASLDATYDLQRFDFALSAGMGTMRITAVRGRNRRFNVEMNTGRYRHSSVITIADNTVLYSPMTEMAVKQLEPGQSLTVRTIDPASMSPIDVVITALRRELLSIGTNTYDATVLSTEYLGMEVASWIDAEGRVLRQETPFGWTLEKCTVEEALATMENTRETTDLLAGMAVPCHGAIPDPRNSRRLVLRLVGVAFSRKELERPPRQSVLSITGNIAEITVLSGACETDAAPALSEEEARRFLASSPYIQSADSKIKAQSLKITGEATSDRAKARAIYRWVYRNVTKEMTASMPSALDVLHTRKGDCNEHTYLFVALARAAGLPAKVVVGLAYHEGSFYYHAWPSVHVGHWLEMDPTWGQAAVDATHIAFVEGELANQLQLVKIMGKLEIEVVGE